MSYLLSVVVPTKDRYPYLFQLIELIGSFNSDELELVVQDNTADNTPIIEYLNTNKCKHLKYFHTKEQLSVSDNSTKAILNSTGEYVCFIGDDDGVTRYIVDAVKWMKENSITTLKSAPAIHKWPSFISTSYYNVSGTAIFNDFRMTYELVNSKDCLRKLLRTGIDTLSYMPKTYNGITERSILDRVYEKCGTFFPGPSPDMANAVSLALEDDYYAYIDAPIIIGGHSCNLGGNASRYKNQCGPLDEQPFIDRKYIDNWNPRIPRVWAATTIWPVSAITALEAYGAQDYLDIVDYEQILRKFIVANPDKVDLAYNLSSCPTNLKQEGFLGRLMYVIKGCRNVAKFFLLKKYDNLTVHKKVYTIIEAEHVITRGVKEFKLIKK